MSRPDPATARQFAVEVVRRLREAGHQSLWAGGCVRDQLLGLTAKDYDVATDARPEQIREIFGRKKTLAIGAAFGVITVVGPKRAGQIDVATFRRDAAYSDGRHPDAVSYADDKQDAFRRDFTINGLFFDPLESRVIDYVGGQDDLQTGIVRAIGDPEARIAEDKLRMLRAVRFAARFGFVLERGTQQAIEKHARELVIVSAERVAAELRAILTHDSRARGVELLANTGMLEVILPESRVLGESTAAWERMLRILAALLAPTFSMALAALVREIPTEDGTIHDLPRTLFERWKLSTDELECLTKLLAEEGSIHKASQIPWPRLQRILIAPRIDELLGYCEAVARGAGVSPALQEVEFCRQKLALAASELNPPPLITGEDLKAAGIPPGPQYRVLLDGARDAQLLGQIATREQALEFVRQWPHRQ
jgi:tRNA nucleotidyltransferase/poly(A) polymerase